MPTGSSNGWRDLLQTPREDRIYTPTIVVFELEANLLNPGSCVIVDIWEPAYTTYHHAHAGEAVTMGTYQRRWSYSFTALIPDQPVGSDALR